MIWRGVMWIALAGWGVAVASAATRSLPMEQKTEPPPPEVLKRTGFEQKLGATLPLDVPVRDEEGRIVPLGTYFKDRPVVFALVYYKCPMLCNLVLNGIVEVMRQVAFEPGQDYEIVTLSFDHTETHVLAAQKKASYVRELARPGAESGWHFLTADEPAIKAVTEAAGFRFAWDERAKEFAHGSGIMVATPDGKLSHYFYGVVYSPRDVRLALVEASSGRIGNPVDQLLLLCYHYNPVVGGYSAAIMNLVRFGCTVTVVAVGSFVWVSWRREKRSRMLTPAAA
ncbi:MAG: SCO family protein [Kiritimatiellae bacterium]|nr:SCO family protein [Kiritimatiellia bacterium]MDW8459089.1 SCO family protein [Verrucomicrobiota bacterium]